MKNSQLGKPIFWMLAIIPLLMLYSYRQDFFEDLTFFNITYNIIPKSLGVLGISLFALNLIISNKLKFIDQLFGGLDKSYLFHKKMGKILYLVLFGHFMAVSLRLLHISPKAILDFALDFTDIPVMMGRIAFYTMTTVVLISIFYKKRYEMVKAIHRIMPFLLILGALHSMAIPTSDIYPYLPLRFYLFTLINIGVILFLARVIGQKYGYFVKRYQVKEIKRLNGDVSEITMSPIDPSQAVQYKPGQFSFYRFNKKSEWKYNGEEHPFSFTSTPANPESISISAKNSGDFTENLSELEPGDTVYVNGGFGSFTLDKAKGNRIVFLAGGIGITPFMSMLRDLKAREEKSYSIDLYYTFSGEENSTFVEELKQLATEGYVNLLTVTDSEKSGRTKTQEILDHTDAHQEAGYYICGPKPMVKQFSKELGEAGVSKDQIHFELFSLFF